MPDEFDNANVVSNESLDSVANSVVDETVNNDSNETDLNDDVIEDEHEYRDEVEVQEPNVKINEESSEHERPSAEGQITDVSMLDKLSDDGTFYSSSTSETQQYAYYDEVLNDLGQLATYTNSLLLAILVFIVLFMGIFSGHVLTTWFRNRQ